MKKKLFVGAALLAAVSVAAAAPAGAAKVPKGENGVAKVEKKVWVSYPDADTATVGVKYRCYGGDGGHLWVSVKQGGPDPTAEGSSATVDSWYDAHPAATCNGEWQYEDFTIARHAADPQYRPQGWAQLEKGPAWVQFCLYPPQGAPVTYNQWSTVKI